MSWLVESLSIRWLIDGNNALLGAGGMEMTEAQEQTQEWLLQCGEYRSKSVHHLLSLT